MYYKVLYVKKYQSKVWIQDHKKKVCESLSHVWLFATPCAVAHQASLSMEFSRQEYWSGLPFLSPGALPDPGIKTGAPALQVDSLPSADCWLQSKLESSKTYVENIVVYLIIFCIRFLLFGIIIVKGKKCHLVSLSVQVGFGKQMWTWALEWEIWKEAEEASLSIRRHWTNADQCILDQSSKSYAGILPFRTVCLRLKCRGPFNSCSAHPADMAALRGVWCQGRCSLYLRWTLKEVKGGSNNDYIPQNQVARVLERILAEHLWIYQISLLSNSVKLHSNNLRQKPLPNFFFFF